MTNEFRGMVVRRCIKELEAIGFKIEKLSAPATVLIEIEAEAVMVQKATMNQKKPPSADLIRLFKEQLKTFAGIPIEVQPVHSDHDPSARHPGDSRQSQR